MIWCWMLGLGWWPITREKQSPHFITRTVLIRTVRALEWQGRGWVGEVLCKTPFEVVLLQRQTHKARGRACWRVVWWDTGSEFSSLQSVDTWGNLGARTWLSKGLSVGNLFYASACKCFCKTELESLSTSNSLCLCYNMF